MKNLTPRIKPCGAFLLVCLLGTPMLAIGQMAMGPEARVAGTWARTKIDHPPLISTDQL
jgi:hypothetical protein